LIEEPRLFIAVPLQEDARTAVVDLVAGVRAGEPERGGVRWVRLDGVHVTLRFLGPTPLDRVPLLEPVLDEAADDMPAFRLRFGGAGTFPPTGRPRTLWLGVTDGADELASLAATVDKALERSGWTAERRPFRAHLTLARADGVPAGRATAAALIAAARDAVIETVVDRLVLFESVTGSGPARYVIRAERPLSTPA
jgi:RNA 2',3'-cyclic 3'-phosphodiesterase